MASLKSINLRLSEKLRDREYREAFFREITQDEIAEQIRALRELRGMRQAELARITGTKQSAISRLEQAEYSGWSFPTLSKIAAALDARLRFTLEPAESAIGHYELLEKESQSSAKSVVDARTADQPIFDMDASAGTRARNVATISAFIDES